MLHDMGKLEEYEGEFAAKVSRIGTLQGHVVIGFASPARLPYNPSSRRPDRTPGAHHP